MPSIEELGFNCPITLDVITDPVKTNCNHHFEKAALATYLRTDNTCPRCRTIITSAAPDQILAKKIQDQFANISKENLKEFNEAKLNVSEAYKEFINQPVLPKNSVKRKVDEEDIDILNIYPREVIKHLPNEVINFALNQIRDNHLDSAENTLALLEDVSSLRKNNAYIALCKKYIAQGKASGYYRAEKICCNNIKTSDSTITDDLLSKIARGYANKNNLFKSAFETGNKIKAMPLRILIFLEIAFKATLYGIFNIPKYLISWISNILRKDKAKNKKS